MIIRNSVDGEAAGWDFDEEERCLCDLEADWVRPLSMGKLEFERAAERLGKRMVLRNEYVSRSLTTRQRKPLEAWDADALFSLRDSFDDIFGSEPLERAIMDFEEMAHRAIGDFIKVAVTAGAATSPMSAGKSFTLFPARSFRTEADILLWREGKKSGWRPSVRLEVRIVVAGMRRSIEAVAGRFSTLTSELGAACRIEASYRKPCLEGVPIIQMFSVIDGAAGGSKPLGLHEQASA